MDIRELVRLAEKCNALVNHVTTSQTAVGLSQALMTSALRDIEPSELRRLIGAFDRQNFK